MRRSALEYALVTVLAPLLALCVLHWTPLSSVQRLAGDALLRAGLAWAPPPAAGVPDVAIVAMDTRSLAAYDDWPWPRGRWAELIGVLQEAGAVAIAFDVDFSTPRDPLLDRAFGAAIKGSRRVVLGAFQDFQELPDGGRIEMFHRPISVLVEGATLGSGMVPFDPDGTVRRARHRAEIGGTWLPSLALATLGVATRSTPDLQRPARRLLDFRRSLPRIPIVSIADLLEGHYDRSLIEGRAVFVGATAPVLQDLWKTPVDARMPGVLIHAIEYRNHAADRVGHPPLKQAGPIAVFGIALLISFLMRVLGAGSHIQRIASSLLVGLGIPGFALAALASRGLLIDPISPLIVVVLHYLWGIERLRMEIRKRLRAREQSIGALVHIGKIASDRLGLRQTQIALELIGGATTANWLVLLPASADGGFQSGVQKDAPKWARNGRVPEPKLDAAQDALAAGQVHLAESLGGKEQELYVPLATGAQVIGVLIAGYPRSRRPDETEIGTIEAVAALVALAGTTDRLIHDLRQASEAAQAASRAKTEFLANMSHEIRTPLNAVLGYTELLRDPALGPEEREAMSDAVRLNGEHVATLINDILDLSRIETGGLALAKARVSPAELASELWQMMRDQAADKGLELSVVKAPDLPETIETDPVRLRQILVNLIANAIKFTQQGFVRLHVGSEDGSDRRSGRLRFEVRDSGIGISPAYLERIFDAFFQADSSSTREGSGTGLGLAVSKRLVGLLGGTIEVESTPDRGSVFIIELPIGAEPERTAAAEPAAATPRAAPIQLSGRVLVAEDGPDNQRIVKMFLSKAGLDVTIAENGQLAVDCACAARDAGEDFDLIFMDIAMPVLDGHGATRALRALDFETPIVALTAHALPSDREAALAAGCDDYMTKPVKRKDLIEMAARQLGARKPAS